MTRVVVAPAVLAMATGLLILPSCSASGSDSVPALPSPAAFSPGPCSQAAPALLAIVRRVDKGGSVGQLDTELTAQQSALRHLPAQTSGIQDVVTAIGFLRLRVDAHSYDDQARKDVGSAARRAVAGCTGVTH